MALRACDARPQSSFHRMMKRIHAPGPFGWEGNTWDTGNGITGGTAAHQVVPATLPNTSFTFGSAEDMLAFRQQTYKKCRYHLPLCRGLPGKCHPPPTPTLGINFVSFHCCSSGVCGAQHGQLSLSELPAQHICTSAPRSGEKESLHAIIL